MIEKTPGLRERHKQNTRAELSNFGLGLFLKQGFANTTIEQIVEPLGIARRTFFRYFKSKEELVFTWHEDKTVELVQELKARPAKESPLDTVCETLATTLKRYDANREMAFALVRLLKETPALLAKECEKRMDRELALAAALVEREGKRTLSPLKARIIVGAVTTAWTAALDEWYEGGGKADLRPIMAKAFSMVREL
ncbi:TetR family transcriptional regulator [Pseudomonas amygdali pv. hibisci]|uniref:TetR family transcriptional regulator n=1 Tax=Pseudomonas amygdali pv. hibisci TaxID=251723 RepID=A0AB34TZI5_PSEA0|nr:TetR family transcriptional regulator [Pseudomonas amygdali]KPX51072.1 TetR family transcriptional regulator [Pseudomonas amygdali pv. hibisci]RMN52903.1 TetR family transcriptional regulator [Pseudomonas amygdali pv. hibisci]